MPPLTWERGKGVAEKRERENGKVGGKEEKGRKKRGTSKPFDFDIVTPTFFSPIRYHFA